VRGTARLAALLALALGSACALGPDYTRPELPAPETFRAQPIETQSIADLPWFEVFRDGALGGYVREALDNNRDLQVAAARVEQARYLAAVARSPLFPQLGYDAATARGDQAVLGNPAPGTALENSSLLAASLFWEVDVWGRIRRSAEAARAELFATEAVRRGVVLSLVSAVAQSYYELLELDLEQAIAQDSVQAYQGTYDLFQRQFEGGVTSKLDPLRADAALAQAEASLQLVELQIVAKENELSVLLGRPAGGLARGAGLNEQTLPPEVPPGIPSQLLERRPDLIEAEQTLVAANARIGVAFTNFFPRIGLSALGGSASEDLSDLLESGTGLWSIAASAAGPIFTAGQTSYDWRAAQAAADASRAAYEGSVLNALREVSDALTAREKLASTRVQQERAVASLRESVRMATTRYVSGLSSYFEVLDAQQELYPAEFALARTRRDEQLAVVALYRALGGGWNAKDPEPEIPLPLAP
jgi:multidrug efflux system outer membrane protein